MAGLSNGMIANAQWGMGHFLPRDAMLSGVYAVVMCLCVCVCASVCLSVCHTPVLYQNG